MSSTIYGIQNIIVQPREGHSYINTQSRQDMSNPNPAREDSSKYHIHISINKKIIKAIVDIICGNISVDKLSSTVCRISVGSSSRTISDADTSHRINVVDMSRRINDVDDMQHKVF